MRRVCKNPKCAEPLGLWSRAHLCPACRYVARWAFAIGAGIVGVAWGVLQLFAALK